MYDVVIVGSTISRIICALSFLKRGKKVLIIESNKVKNEIINMQDVVGFLSSKYCNMRDEWLKEIYKLGGVIVYEDVISIKTNKIKKIITNKNTYSTKSIVFALGNKKKTLELDNEHKFIDKNIFFCLNCVHAILRGKRVCVYGDKYDVSDLVDISNICKKLIIITDDRGFDNSKYEKLNNTVVYFESKIVKINGDDSIESVIIDRKNRCIDVDILFIMSDFVPNMLYFDINNYNGIFIEGNNFGNEIVKLVLEYLDK